MTRVDELEREGKFEQAARQAQAAGDLSSAARLFERACDYVAAARCALLDKQPALALRLACQSGSDDLLDDATRLLGAEPTSQVVHGAELCRPRWPATAGRLYEAASLWSEAAACYEAARDLGAAGRCLLKVPDPRGAARALETRLTRHPDDLPSRLLLAELLLDHGRARPALTTLQAAPPEQQELEKLGRLKARAARALGLVKPTSSLEAVADSPKSSASDADGDLLFGRYSVSGEFARTANARVLRARDVVNGGEVAVKLYAPTVAGAVGRDVLLRFEREARALASLRHRAILPLIEYVPSGPAVVTRWMEGGSLAALLQNRALSPARGREITLSVLSALEAAHRQGLLHRDIKPSNILLDASGAAYLADFGAAHMADASNTVTSGLIGTLGYMAPEVRGGAAATIRSDLYGVGAVLFHVLTGAPPDLALPFLSGALTTRHKTLVRRLVGTVAERPEDAHEMSMWLARASFPDEIPEHRGTPDNAPPSDRQDRLTWIADSSWFDELLDRNVAVHPAEPQLLERAREFARAGHPGLATIYALREELWVEAPESRPEQALGAGERKWLRAALCALHSAGGVHGAVTLDQLGLRGGQAVLRFLPEDPRPGVTAEDDLRALEKL